MAEENSQKKPDVIKQAPLFQNELTVSKRIIYTPSVFARSTLLYIQEVGSLKAITPHVVSRTGLKSYLFFTVTSGKGKLEYQGETYELKEGDCVFIDCRTGYQQCASDHRAPVEYHADAGMSGSSDDSGVIGKAADVYDELWSLSWIHFDGAMMEAIYRKYRERGGKAVFSPKKTSDAAGGCNGNERYQELVEDVFSIASSDSYVRDMQIAEKITGLLSLLMEDAWDQEDNDVHAAPKRKLVKEVKEYIDVNYKERMSLETLAGQFYINKEYLSQLFREEYGVTVNGYISQVRVSKAKNLLRFTDDTVEQIGEAVGIGDGNYFARVFKRVEGMSPSAYRKSW